MFIMTKKSELEINAMSYNDLVEHYATCMNMTSLLKNGRLVYALLSKGEISYLKGLRTEISRRGLAGLDKN